jgi:hypothetical protein
MIGNGPTLTLLYQEYVWSNSIEENGPNKFLIHSTCNEVRTVNEEFSWTVPFFWVTFNLIDEKDFELDRSHWSIKQTSWFLLPYNKINIYELAQQTLANICYGAFFYARGDWQRTIQANFTILSYESSTWFPLKVETSNQPGPELLGIRLLMMKGGH